MKRKLLTTVLATTATKREAKQYMQKYAAGANDRHVSILRVSGRGSHEALRGELGRGLARTCALLSELGSYPVVVLDGSQEIAELLNSKKRLPLRQCESRLQWLASAFSNQISSFGAQSLAIQVPFEVSGDRGVWLRTSILKHALDNRKVPVLLPVMYDNDMNENKLLSSFEGCRQLAKELSVPYKTDKLIFVDPVGGLPSLRRRHAAHVLVNLMQEFGEISAELRSLSSVESEGEAHLQNLNAMHEILSVCGPQCTGLITDPEGASTALDRNPIVYNLLTDRPLISPSLPPGLSRTQLRTSLVRTGFPVYVRRSAGPNEPLDLELEDKVGNISLTKLQRLMEKSFKRKLDLQHYLNRIQDAVAAVIVVGDYDGCAIITYERSPLTNRKIAYLDKFAVDPSRQGAQGVADIMLIQMIRRLFPNEMLWRSRNNNPVNKWYFERSRGHLRLKDSQWTMFWITNAQCPPIEEYESVCRNIVPSLKS